MLSKKEANKLFVDAEERHQKECEEALVSATPHVDAAIKDAASKGNYSCELAWTNIMDRKASEYDDMMEMRILEYIAEALKKAGYEAKARFLNSGVYSIHITGWTKAWSQ